MVDVYLDMWEADYLQAIAREKSAVASGEGNVPCIIVLGDEQ